MTRLRALLYGRVSFDQFGRSVPEQLAEGRSWAEREGWDIVRVIEDRGSASRFGRSTGKRSRWAEVTEALSSGEVDVLVTWEASRATRDLAVYAELRDLCAKTGVLWGYSGSVYDLGKREDRFRTGLDALLSEDESHRTSERVQRSVRARATAGQPHGKIPYGYRREYDQGTGTLLRQVPDEATAPVVREIFRRVADGDGLHTIAVDLTRRGISIPRPPRTPRKGNGTAWIDSTVKRIATNPTNAGLRTHRGEVVGDAAWPALVDRDLFDKVQAILTDPARHTRTGDSTARWLLSGIAACGIPDCGGPMRVYTNRGNKSYTCSWCYKVTRKCEPVDDHVRSRVAAAIALIDVDGVTATDDSALAEARAELAALRDRLEAFTDSAADGEVTPQALARIEAKLRPQIRAAQLRVRQLEVPPALAKYDLSDPVAWWKAASIGQQRDFLRAAMSVTILPAGRGRRTFDPDLVVVEPRW